MPQSKRSFSWDMLETLAMGRPHLGPAARLEIYRLMQFSLRHVLEETGHGSSTGCCGRPGRWRVWRLRTGCWGPSRRSRTARAGCRPPSREYGIGILRIEEADLEKGRFVFTVEEDMDCSGLPETDMEICKFDEGFIAGILESSTGESSGSPRSTAGAPERARLRVRRRGGERRMTDTPRTAGPETRAPSLDQARGGPAEAAPRSPGEPRCRPRLNSAAMRASPPCTRS